MSAIDPYDPVVAARNHKLGLILMGLVLLVVVAFIIRFALAGLPEDYKEWSRIQQRQSADSAVSQPD